MITQEIGIKGFIEKCRENMHHLVQDRKGKEVEYGYYHGRIEGLLSLSEREEPEINPLDLGVRLCPTYGVVRYSYMSLRDVHTLFHGAEGCAYLNKLNFDFLLGDARPLGQFSTTAMSKTDTILGSEGKLKEAIMEIGTYQGTVYDIKWEMSGL